MKRANEILIWALLLAVGVSLLYTNIIRADVGWFDDGTVIFVNNVLYVIFFGLMSGYVIAKILGKR